MSQGPACTVCGWELRDSDVHCCLCGTSQREVAAAPPALVLAPVDGEGRAPGAEVVSPGLVELKNVGSHSLQVLSIEPPEGVEVSTEPPLGGSNGAGFLLRLGGVLRLAGSRSGDVAVEASTVAIHTSIGALRLPVHARPLPKLDPGPLKFLLARDHPARLVLALSLAEGVEQVRIEVKGPGLELLEPTAPVRLEADSPLQIVFQADPAGCLGGTGTSQLLVHLADQVRLAWGLSFLEALPGRLLAMDGANHRDFRVFPQEVEPVEPWRRESLRYDLELKNLGMLAYHLERIELLSHPQHPIIDEICHTPLDPQRLTVELPYVIAPRSSVLVRIECSFFRAPGSVQDGTLVLSGAEGVEPFRFAIRLDSRQPPEYALPVGLDFGTSASAVATRRAERGAPAGRVLSVPFRPRFDEQHPSPFLPSDVQIIRDPESDEPIFEIDWGDFRGLRHLTFARNLKRRLGLAVEDPEGVEPIFFEGVRTDLPVEDLAAFVVYEMKRQVERHLGARLTHGIATVPTRFSLRRIQAIREVYRRAGFQNVTLIDESVAAGILGMYNQFRELERYTLLVYDMGGGTTDVTLFEVENRRVAGVLEIRPKILGVTGSARLGGRDVTDRMVQRAIGRFSADERQRIPWPDQLLETPELQAIGKSNLNNLFLRAEEIKLRLFDKDEAPPELPLTPILHDIRNQAVQCTETIFTRADVEGALLPQLESLWREVRDLLDVSGVKDLDILYLVGRSAQLPILRDGKDGLLGKLTADGRSPRLELYFPKDRAGNTVLKEAVSLGACLAQDLLYGVDERLVTEDLEERSASRFGIRNQRGEFLEILPPGSGLGKPSEKRVSLPLVASYGSGRYQLRLEVWENPTQSNRIDDNPDAELLSVVNLDFTAAEIGPPTNARAEVGLVLREDRTLVLLAGINGQIRREVAVSR
jgi:molecular chaperone DnaK (HSP70)